MKPNKQNPLQTVLTITLGFSILFFFFKSNWMLFVGISVGIIGLFSPQASKWIHTIWMHLTKLLGYVVPNILLSIVFYCFLFPVSLLSKLFGASNTLKLKSNKESLWVEKSEKFNRSSFEKMW